VATAAGGRKEPWLPLEEFKAKKEAEARARGDYSYVYTPRSTNTKKVDYRKERGQSPERGFNDGKNYGKRGRGRY
jgi:hypothetical protein